MTQPRLSTVYDYANLRLHPDGTRVYQKADNARPHLVRITTQGPRDSWIARDASGSGKVSQFRKGKSRQKDASEEPGEEIDLDGDEGAEGKRGERRKEEGEQNSDEDGGDDPEDSDYGGPSGKRKLSQRDKRKLKRQKFAANFDYLSEPQPFPVHGSQHSTEADNSQTIEQELPQPSTDLLKSIHRFAAEFYTERGQLLNISREYRKERKLRRLQKLGKLGKQRRRSKARRSGSSAGSGTRDVSEDDEEEASSKEASGEEDEGDAEDEDEEGDDEEEEEEDEAEEEEDDGESDSQEDEDDTAKKKTPRKDIKGKGKPKPKTKRKKNPRSKKLYRDMYKMFDGSAILAIGMLVQEMIVDMVDTQMPVGWKEEMDQTYGSRIDDVEDQLDVGAVIGGENERKGRHSKRNKDKKREEQEEDQDGDEEGEKELQENKEQEDGDDEDEDHGIAVASKVGSPPLTQNDDGSDLEMNEVVSGLETHDEEESDDDSD